MVDVTDLTRVPTGLDSRAATFENPTGARGAGGAAAAGRKGAPSRDIQPGERVTLADLRGPGTVRHVWMTFPPGPPEQNRALYLEVFYDELTEPSISVPCLDFFGAPHGRPVGFASALSSIQEARGCNSFVPMAFGDRFRAEFVNGSSRPVKLYYQVDYTLEETAGTGRLHASFRRQNPTAPREDFVICEGLAGPGRFLGCVLGVRPLDPGTWYGEGEVKVYRDGDTELPTICGTGLEDYVGTAWGMGPHHALYGGAPLEVREPGSGLGTLPEFVGCYRWHVLDPIVFAEELRVTIQQIGADHFLEGEQDRLDRAIAEGRVAGNGIQRRHEGPVIASGLFERIDDYCATAFVVCERPQPVPKVDIGLATADLSRRSYEEPDELEFLFA
ncbi:glycoside hydrolase family 172 protein [Amycolatopsis aidingensis]|uniref:glycoside hydrolase family 172 protein n=1 Tax=Amycolatopsis aidingensis TaxID=2842453 RepID=UPI001C0B006E|nr:glycoside hydrolase family 172 protein [Amycolatopsis aidingensis]